MRSFTTTQFFAGEPWPSEPFAFRMVLLDIPNTVVSAIKALPAHCKAVTLATDLANSKNIALLERTARRKGIRIMWNDGFRKRNVAEINAMGRIA